MFNVVGIMCTILAIIAAAVAFFLSEDEAYGWAAGIYLLAAILFGLSGIFLYLGKARGARPLG